MTDFIACTTAADVFERHLGLLNHPDGPVKLVQFTHDSPGLQKVRRQIAEALVWVLESNGHEINRVG